MTEIILNLNPVIASLIASTITFLITTLGSSLVFLFKRTNKDVMDSMLGFSAGVMIAASFFSLLSPSINLSIELNYIPWLIASIGFMCGGILIYLGDKLINKINSKKGTKKLKRNIMLVTSIVLHNIPEGMAIGVAFGSLFYENTIALTISAWMLAIGIGIQNFPEGSAVSLPLHRDGMSKKNSFLIGGLSALVEPFSALLGVLLVLKIKALLPILLAFAAGAMIYVATSELIPESQTNKNKGLITLLTLIGFTIMMILDVALS